MEQELRALVVPRIRSRVPEYSLYLYDTMKGNAISRRGRRVATDGDCIDGPSQEQAPPRSIDTTAEVSSPSGPDPTRGEQGGSTCP